MFRVNSNPVEQCQKLMLHQKVVTTTPSLRRMLPEGVQEIEILSQPRISEQTDKYPTSR